MGTVSSQTGPSKLNVLNESGLNKNTDIGKQPRILVSINSDNTVRISEGISIATQTPRDGNSLTDTTTETKKENFPDVKDTKMKKRRENKFVQTDDKMEKVNERKIFANKENVVMLQQNSTERKHENDNDIIKEDQKVKQNEYMRREGPESESDADVTDFWTDTGVQTDDELTAYGLRIAWDSKSVDVSDGISQHFKEATIKENIEIEKESKTVSPISVDQNKSIEHDVKVVKSPEVNRTDENIELNPSTLDSQDLKTEKCNEDEETTRVPEHNLPRLIRPFDLLSLERYGKYKVRLSSDKEKCIVSSAAFLETGDAVLIDRSNQKVKFVDKTFQFISSHELPAKPWAICAKGHDIYVTLGNTKIQHLVVEDMILEPVKSFEIKGRCLGICVLNSHLAVGLQVGEVCLLDSDGKRQGIIQLPTISGKPCNPWHLTATSEGNILVTDSDACTLFCVNQKSELIFTFKQLGSPRGTAVDSEGNILVVGRDKETGAVVSIVHKDEELRHMLHIEQEKELKYRVLMTWEQLEFVPYCVCFRKDRVVVLGGIQESLKIMTL